MTAKDQAPVSCPIAIICAAAVLSALVPASIAEDAVPTPATAGNATTNLMRDPFWPVGYWPKPKGPPAETNKAPVSSTNTNVADTGTPPPPPPPPPPPEDPPKWPDLRVKGTMRTPSGYLATLDGIKGVVEAGQTVRKIEGKYEYSWKINSISSDRVSHTRLSFRKIK